MAHYPKAPPIGGSMLRAIIHWVRSRDIVLPLEKKIGIAVSGGADSVAAAHLLVRYGRRIVPKHDITILHINHKQRGEESDQDALFVKDLAEKLEVPFQQWELPDDLLKRHAGDSVEKILREARLSLFEEWCTIHDGYVITAHHGDDVVETLLWRLFTGSGIDQQSILFQYGSQLRLFLPFRKADLLQYCEQVGQSFRVDKTNFNNRFLRSRLRLQLLPVIEQLFPRAVDHLLKHALRERYAEHSVVGDFAIHQALVQGLQQHTKILDIRCKKYHYEQAFLQSAREGKMKKEIHLPGGWILVHKKKEKSP